MGAFVTGGTGFIGAHIARTLVERGTRVRCLVRPTSFLGNLAGLKVETVAGDLTDAASLRRAMSGCDVVYHCGADYRLFASDTRELYRNNVEGTQNVLAVAAELGVRRIVYTSSVGTLRPADDATPVDESARGTLSDMVGHYKRSKLLAEREAESWAERGLPVVIVSPSTPIGEGDAKPTPTGQLIVDFLNGRLPAYVDTGLNVVDVRDVAVGHVLAAERGRPGESYILGNVNLTLRQILKALADVTGLRAPRLKLPHWIPLAVAHVQDPVARWTGHPPRVPLEGARMARKNMFFDPGKAVRELGLPLGSIEAAMTRAVGWFIDHKHARLSARTARIS